MTFQNPGTKKNLKAAQRDKQVTLKGARITLASVGCNWEIEENENNFSNKSAEGKGIWNLTCIPRLFRGEGKITFLMLARI